MKLLLEKYPDRVPVYVNKKENSDIDDISKHKYLVPNDMTMGQFIYILRKRIKMDSKKALFVFVNNMIVCNSDLMGTVYNKNKDEDGFLYMVYSGENTFG